MSVHLLVFKTQFDRILGLQFIAQKLIGKPT